MGIDPKDNDVLHLLKKLKDANGAYPPDLLSARRQGYLKQVAQISGGAGLAVALKETVKHGKGTPALTGGAGTLLEGLLVVAIVIEASAVAYFYRDKLTDLFQSITGAPTAEQISNPPVIASPIPELELTPSPVFTLTGTQTETATPVGTPSLMAGQPTNKPGTTSNTGGSTTQAVSTPNASDPNGNNGNQYGLTPKPERTKDPGNNNNDGDTNDTNNDNNSDGNQSDPKKKK